LEKDKEASPVQHPFGLLRTRRFLPLFLVQVTSAFADNLYKTAFIMAVTYRLDMGAAGAGRLAGFAAAALVAPFFLFSGTAGQLADGLERSGLVRHLKTAELGVALIAALTFAIIAVSPWPSLLAVFAFGAQAAFSSPVKYALLPQLLTPEELVAGNGLLEAGTFLSILLGTVAGGLAAVEGWNWAVPALLILSVVPGVVASRFVPKAPAPSPGLAVTWLPLGGTGSVLGDARRQPVVQRAILAISWFWLVGAVALSQFPSWAKETLHAGSAVVTLFLAAFSIGIGIGALFCNRLLQGGPTARLAPKAALAMAIATALLWLLSPAPTPGATLIGFADFLGTLRGWLIFLALTGLAIAGGVFVVPLYAVMQQRSQPENRARIVAANNIWNAIFMTAATLLVAILLSFGLPVAGVFLLLALGTVVVSVLLGLGRAEE
jgi:acyl-[acyl-carrier-protein]-phospholipid O-acyltransferase/long-chain-fatty-acid--[acyl-carrier-protein] ligase